MLSCVYARLITSAVLGHADPLVLDGYQWRLGAIRRGGVAGQSSTSLVLIMSER